MAEEKRYLDYDGLAYLVEKLTGRIAAVGGDYLPLKGGTISGDLKVEGALMHDPEDEEDLADAKWVIGIGSGSSNNFVKIAPSQFNTGTAHGAYVAYYDKDNVPRICTASDWSSSLGTAAGIAIIAGGRSFVLSDSLGRAAWSADTSTLTGQTDFYSAAYAMQDFDGARWAQMHLDAYPDDTTSAFGLCQSYNSGNNGKGLWRLPTAGEWMLIHSFDLEVVKVQNALGQDPFEGSDSDHWTATEYGGSYAYHWDIDDGPAFTTKSTTKDVRAVREWVWIE